MAKTQAERSKLAHINSTVIVLFRRIGATVQSLMKNTLVAAIISRPMLLAMRTNVRHISVVSLLGTWSLNTGIKPCMIKDISWPYIRYFANLRYLQTKTESRAPSIWKPIMIAFMAYSVLSTKSWLIPSSLSFSLYANCQNVFPIKVLTRLAMITSVKTIYALVHRMS